MKTDISEYTLIAIFLIIIEEKKVYPITFHSCIFKVTELNYNIHNKELFIMFEVFHTWHYYLEGSELSISIITDYKNLETS